MVTGASGPIGHALVPLLLRDDEVRAAVRSPHAAEALRGLGAKVTVGRLDDADALAEVLRYVYTVIHLVGGPNQPDEEALLDANHGSVVRALSAAKVAGVHRFVLISAPGASVDADDPYLRARGLAEEAVVTSGLDHAVIRSTHAYGAGSLWFATVVLGAGASPPQVVGDGSQPVAPVAVEDVASVLAAVDDRPGGLAGTWALEGPDVVTADGMETLLAGEASPRPDHVDGETARVAVEGLLGIPISPWTIARFAAPSRADAPPAADEFGISRTPLVAGVRGALERAAVTDE